MIAGAWSSSLLLQMIDNQSCVDMKEISYLKSFKIQDEDEDEEFDQKIKKKIQYIS